MIDVDQIIDELQDGRQPFLPAEVRLIKEAVDEAKFQVERYFRSKMMDYEARGNNISALTMQALLKELHNA